MASPPRRTPRKKRLSKWRVFLLASGSIFAVASIAILVYVISAVAQTPNWHPDTLTNQKESSLVFDKDGNQIATLHATENRQMAKSSDIPDLVKKTFVAVEDKRFYSHFGVDPIRVLGSFVADVKSQSLNEGASTITMQLARNAFIENPTQKTGSRKLQEVALAIQLEREYTKDEILTFYLNRIFFGESSFGIQAAAKTYFGKELKDLKPDEIAMLAGLPQAPSGYDPYVKPEQAKNRRTIVLGVMKDAELITPDEYNQYKDSPFTHVDDVKKNRAASQKPMVAGADYQFPYFIDHVIDQLVNEYNLSEEQIFSGGLQIHTTVDPKIQAAAEKEFANAKNFPQSVDDQKVQGAMTVIEPSTGAIRAIVGGRDHTTARALNRASQSPRQPGSTFKPLVVYAPALEKGGFFPGTVLDDMPVKYNGGNGKVYAPVDFDTETSGWKGRITMRYAVENSVNVYAVKLMNLVGLDYATKFAKERLGLPLQDEDKYNLSIALGSREMTTLDMASAYGVFANDGVRVTPHAIDKVLDSQGKEVLTPKITKERTMKETTAYLINSMLRSVVTNGTGTRAQFGNWAVAGKTGTTSLPDTLANRSGNPDAWFAGYTPDYVGVVWMGYDQTDSNHYLRNVYGGSFPAQIWKNVMIAAHEGKTVQTEFKQPAGIVSGSFDAKSGLLPSSLTPDQFVRTEIAAQGSFPTSVSDVWVEKEIDADHPTYLAGTGTKNKLPKVFLNITDRDATMTWPGDEAPYKMPTETYNESSTPTGANNTTPPAGDPKLPVPTLGPVAYDASHGTASIPVAYPEASKKLTLVVYVKLPGQPSIQTFTPEAQPGKSDKIIIPLSMDGKSPTPGEYVFWAAFKDPKTSLSGPSSPAAKLTIND